MGRQWPGLLIGVFLGAIFGAFGGYVRGATGAQEAVGRRLWSESRRLPRLARPSMDGSGGKYVFSPPARLHGQPIVFCIARMGPGMCGCLRGRRSRGVRIDCFNPDLHGQGVLPA